MRSTSVIYELSTGQEAEMFVEVDDRGRGDGYIYVDGEALVHVTTDGAAVQPACVLCIGGAAVSGAMGSDIADGYCE